MYVLPTMMKLLECYLEYELIWLEFSSKNIGKMSVLPSWVIKSFDGEWILLIYLKFSEKAFSLSIFTKNELRRKQILKVMGILVCETQILNSCFKILIMRSFFY